MSLRSTIVFAFDSGSATMADIFDSEQETYITHSTISLIEYCLKFFFFVQYQPNAESRLAPALNIS